jgi:hypothetical protein
VIVGGLTRGSGVKQGGSGATGGWGGTGFTNATSAAAITANQFVTFSMSVSNGYKFSLGSLSRFDYYRSATGAQSVLLQFQVGSGTFTDITNLTYSTSGAGASENPVDVSGIAALQNVGANTNVTFRIVNYGGTGSSGSWYVYNTAGTTAPDLAVSGTVLQIVTATNVPVVSGATLAGGDFQLTITGAAAASYTVYGATNLVNPQWVSLLTTNPASVPFTFTDTNHFAQRFYRVSSP